MLREDAGGYLKKKMETRWRNPITQSNNDEELGIQLVKDFQPSAINFVELVLWDV